MSGQAGRAVLGVVSKSTCRDRHALMPPQQHFTLSRCIVDPMAFYIPPYDSPLPDCAGAANKQFDLGPINVGQARHTGVIAEPVQPFKVSHKSRRDRLRTVS